MPDYRQMAYDAAVRYGVNPNIFLAQIQQESGFLPTAYNKRSGATGIAQIMSQYHPSVNAKDPVASLDYAARLMAGYLEQYGGDYAKALAAYNSGPGTVAKYGGVPPFPETQEYVSKIMAGNQTAQGGPPMAETPPLQVIGRPKPYWINKKVIDPQTGSYQVQYVPLEGASGGVFGIGAHGETPPDGEEQMLEDGTIWRVPADGGGAEYVTTDRAQSDRYKVATEDTTPPPRYFPGEGGSEQRYDPVTGETKPIYQPPADTSKKPYVRNETGEQMPNEDYVPTSTFEDTDGNDRVLRDKLTGRIISRLGPIAIKPGEGTFTHGQTVYRWGADGKPVAIYEFPAGADADAVQWATLAQRKAEFEAKQKADAETAERAWKQFVEEQERSDARNRLTNTTNFTNDILSTWTKAAPMALLPGQTQFLGANPGGLMDRIAQMGRFTPDEAARNVQPFNIDPDVALQWARNAAAGGK